MNEILKLASQFARQKRTHFSFILSKNKIVSVGEEQRWKTHPLAVKYGYKYPTIHSELDAFRNLPAKYKNSKLSLINIRISPTGKFGMSRPCKYCRGWVEEIFDQIWYTNEHGVFQKHETG